MDFAITAIRFLVGIVVLPLLAIFWFAIWPFEILVGVIALPIAAVILTRAQIKESWLGKWPYNTLRQIPDEAEKIWSWVHDDWDDE